MTTPELTPELEPEIPVAPEKDSDDERKRRILLLLLLLLLLCLCCVGIYFVRYLANPQPLPDLLPQPISQNINYPPTFKFLITELDAPVGVAVSPDGQRIYATESSGQRMIKMFDRDGNLLKSFAPPGTTASNRKPAFIAVDAVGRVFVTDTYNDTIAVFDPDGNFIDGIIQRNVTISSLIAAQNNGAVPEGALFYFDNIYDMVNYQLPNGDVKKVEGPNQDGWSPLGLRFDLNGNLLVTNIIAGRHSVLIFPEEALNGSWLTFNPNVREFGQEGNENGEFSFPNSVVTDSAGNFYVSDGNNARVSTWTPDLQYKTFFGFGSADSALNLPRGLWIDARSRLHVVDTVGQYVRVYDVSGAEPVFLYNFGTFGIAEGEFNFPNDICIDGTSRLYIADRENNRIQVWSY